MPTWDDAQYRKFIDARTRPAAELLSRVPLESAAHVLDLGCGPGNSTELLQRRWPGARVVGIDSSLDCVRPGGVLAVQMPCNFDEPSHRLMREVSREYALEATKVRAIPPLLEAHAYYDLLAPLSRAVDLWQTRYEHVMNDAEAIVEWVKGTGLRPFLEALRADQRDAFLARYTEAIADAYPARRDGRRLFSFPRLFMVALRA